MPRPSAGALFLRFTIWQQPYLLHRKPYLSHFPWHFPVRLCRLPRSGLRYSRERGHCDKKLARKRARVEALQPKNAGSHLSSTKCAHFEAPQNSGLSIIHAEWRAPCEYSAQLLRLYRVAATRKLVVVRMVAKSLVPHHRRSNKIETNRFDDGMGPIRSIERLDCVLDMEVDRIFANFEYHADFPGGLALCSPAQALFFTF